MRSSLDLAAARGHVGARWPGWWRLGEDVGVLDVRRLSIRGAALLGVAAACSACTAPSPPPRTPAPALLDELDKMGCWSRPRATGAAASRPATAPPPVQERKDGRLHGTSVFFHPNGQRQMERHYTEGLEDGVFKQWASDGRLLGQFEMKAGTGTMMWWCENGTLSEQRGLRDGMEDGAVMRWSCDGVLSEKGQSVAGKREGEWQRFDGSGRLLARERYVGYELDGAASQLWPDRGQTRWDRTYVKGRLEGPTAWFDDAGRKFVEGTYRQGAPAGTWTAYFANGKKREEVVLDPKAPRSTTWDPDGIQSVVVEMDASWNVVRIDGKDARAACLTGWFNVQTDRIWESPMAFEARGRVPCSEVPPAADPGANGKGDSKKVVR